MDFIFMLTRDDRTIADCLRVIDQVTEIPLTDIGFKDVGADVATLRSLAERIHARGARAHLEIVSTDRVRAKGSVRAAVDLGVDRVMGGVWVADAIDLLRDTGIDYLPFVGDPRGHPTALHGDSSAVADGTAAAVAAGAAGVDLLAYRAVRADPLDLVRAARRATTGQVVVAGSIATPEQVDDLAAAGVDAFTIGDAALSGTFDRGSGSLITQLERIIETTNAAPAAII